MNQNMVNAIKLMRYPFSVFLMPIFWFALCAYPEANLYKALSVFLLVHGLLYPASNGYNSWFDKDEGSIGGLKNPPPVNPKLIWLVNISDLLAIVWAAFISWPFAGLMLIYIVMSRAYSNPATRLKKRPFAGTLTVITFQGGFMFLAMQYGMGNSISQLFSSENLVLALVSSLFLLGSYPLTQIYQHEEDGRRGDRTLSIILGINGTFIFSGISFGLATLILCLDLGFKFGPILPAVYLFGMVPVLIIFTKWMLKVVSDRAEASFENTMQMNKVSSIMLSVVFITMWLLKTNGLAFANPF